MNILVFNAGSSSLKSCLYSQVYAHQTHSPDSIPTPQWKAQIDWTFQPGLADLSVTLPEGKTIQEAHPATARAEVIHRLLATLDEGNTSAIAHPSEIQAIGHRIVHGGAEYQNSTVITPAVKAAIAHLTELAPTHHPAHLEAIEAVTERFGADIPQIAVFDTAFHSKMPPYAAAYPGPYEWLAQGLRRYGFHGISHQYVAKRVAVLMNRPLGELRLVTCHLGNGCSLAAVQAGRSINTTMGYTPLDGVMMGTRSGAVDPGLLIHLLRQGVTVDDLDRILNRESGLKGISGVSNDLRQIMQAIEEGSDRAQLAYDMFIHRLQMALGGMIASLGGVDAIAFTAGIGENAPDVRQRVCGAFEYVGVRIDPERNLRSPMDIEISATDSSVRVFAVHTQEDWEIAQECQRVLKS